ncbi:MAG: branched-chain amino acid ABC transporter permease, partial [Mycobacteriales bacterium]
MITAFSILTLVAIFAIPTMALRLQVSEGGLVNFGIAANFGVGAYAYAIWTLHASHEPGAMSIGFALPTGLGILLAILVGAVAALLMGWVAVHLQPIYFALVTFSFLVIMGLLLTGAQSFADGSQGLSGIASPFPASVTNSNLEYTTLLLVVVGAVTLGIGLLLRRLSQSPAAALLQFTRDDRLASATLGIQVRHVQLGTFVLGGVVASIGGVFYGWYAGSVAPSSFTISVTFTIFIAMIVGGRRSYLGSLLCS